MRERDDVVLLDHHHHDTINLSIIKRDASLTFFCWGEARRGERGEAQGGWAREGKKVNRMNCNDRGDD